MSSTFRDLKEEREKVLQAILEMKVFPCRGNDDYFLLLMMSILFESH